MQGDGLQVNRVDHAGGRVALHTITTWDLDLLPNYVMLVLGNEGGGPHHMQGCYTWAIGLVKGS